MATAILSSRNSFSHQLDHRNPNFRRRKQRSPTKKKTTMVESPPAVKNTNLVMGKVKILKRGETLNSFEINRDREDDDDDLKKKNMIAVDSIKRLGPEPEIVQKQIGGFKGLKKRIGYGYGYAGSNCSVSPPPSSVPIPKFLV